MASELPYDGTAASTREDTAFVSYTLANPAAYLVDLLQFINRNPNDVDHFFGR